MIILSQDRPRPSMSLRSPRGVTRVELLVLIASLGVALLATQARTQSSAGHNAEMVCQSRLGEIGKLSGLVAMADRRAILHPMARARYARHRHAADSERTLILRSIRAVYWMRFEEAA